MHFGNTCFSPPRWLQRGPDATLPSMRLRDFTDRLPSQNVLGLLFVLFLSYFTIFHNYSTPQHFFWDENYHIASAQKYLNGVFFMEPHPPLGKMLIALGEKIIHPNPRTDDFIGTDYAQNPPSGFSFTGYRFMPVLFAWLTAPLVFGIFLLLTRRTLWAIFLSFFYVFDNAMIVHLRGAMLEGPLLFFACSTILAFLLLLEYKNDAQRFAWASVLFGASFAAVMLTKVFGLILVLLVPALFLMLRGYAGRFTRFLGWSALAFLPLYIGVWQAHFSIATKINPSLPDAGYYQASPVYKQILALKKTSNPMAFPVMFRDSQKFVGHYERGVPKLNLCKKDENGSPWFLWPFGGRAINYRWETPNGQAFRYLYLQVNPVIWFLGLLGVAGAAFLLIAPLFVPLRENIENRPMLLTFFVLYVGFMAAVSQITRVMYLYHYFIPLLLTLFLFALVFMELRSFGKYKTTENGKLSALLCIGLLVFVAYQFYRPLTYYEALTDKQFQRRSFLKIWELHCVHCPQQSPFVIQADSPAS